MVHSAAYWRERCIGDSSTEKEENTPPNLYRGVAAGEKDGYSSTGTCSILADLPPRQPKDEEARPVADDLEEPATSPLVRPPRSPTTSSPVPQHRISYWVPL
ncbi:hypothetical protein F441_10525 [Phytophthora nicotianae CJ01A1]|uniref:Uncharacterized protein n=4 Tax=Phytophthora nicotianae TaxID=4792 RepID=V9F305_PHYNI|nr:hypothetical protein F443_10582 [Phytophthora nicotianae P1569]ETK84725.1 hypothetical protein L915_10342 [Phytophthora nicotianae]ETO73368.1 hypothetical protein F444_10683 [Phytophthora nicotianae P1976]ETP14543.1 hypothetical protein F441_10525 [Phytophthora nicotianae CJ01A1]ETL38151.1 hypothetical protein L916_10242 [Phytophthora nicotianae]